MKRFGWTLMLGAIALAFLQTRYFGWNYHPQSDAELFADMICGTISLVGLAFVLGERK